MNFSGPGELYQFEPQDNEFGKIMKFKPFSIYPENFKSIFLWLSRTCVHKEGPKKSENGLSQPEVNIFKNFNRVQTSDIYQSFFKKILEIGRIVSEKSPGHILWKKITRNRTKTIRSSVGNGRL